MSLIDWFKKPSLGILNCSEYYYIGFYDSNKSINISICRLLPHENLEDLTPEAWGLCDTKEDAIAKK